MSFVRTNNKLEAYHRVLNFRVETSNNGMYVLVVKLFQEPNLNRFLIMNLFDSVPVRVKALTIWKDMIYSDLWEKLDKKLISAKIFLELASRKVVLNHAVLGESRLELEDDV